MHMTKTLKTTDRKMSYFYGARALMEAFYLEDFYELDRPDPAAVQRMLDSLGVPPEMIMFDDFG